jgi:hypothetical protein
MKRALLAVLLVLGCSEAPTGPAPAVFDLVLVGATDQVGAILLNVEGGPVDSVVPTRFYTASAPYSGVARQVLVAGATLTGAVARVYVSDGGAGYRAVIREIAAAGTHELLPAGAYHLVLTRVPLY